MTTSILKFGAIFPVLLRATNLAVLIISCVYLTYGMPEELTALREIISANESLDRWIHRIEFAVIMYVLYSTITDIGFTIDWWNAITDEDEEAPENA